MCMYAMTVSEAELRVLFVTFARNLGQSNLRMCDMIFVAQNVYQSLPFHA